MKRIALAVCALQLCILLSCSKNDAPVRPEKPPLRLVKKIVRTQVSGQLFVDSTAYTYDSGGHLIATVNPQTNQPTRRFIYDGDNLVALIDYINGQPDTLKNPVKLLDGGNTIFIDFTRPNPNGGYDSIQVTYKWSGNQLLEAWTYLHQADPGFPSSLQKRLISYNASGNEVQHTMLHEDGTTSLQSRGLAYDQKRNYFSAIPRLNYIFMGWGSPHATRSVNNPVKAEGPISGQLEEYEWSYNEDDFPLTMKIKGQNFLALELQYNR